MAAPAAPAAPKKETASANASKALELFERALQQFEALGDRAGVARTLESLGDVHRGRGDFARALAHYERALALWESLGDRAGVARSLLGIGEVHLALGNPSSALAFFERALREAERLGAADLVARALAGISAARLQAGDAGAASSAARRAVETVSGLMAGLADEQAATARAQFDVFETGVRAALRAGDAAEATYFLEAGRAGSLLEALSSREALRAVVLAEDVRRAEADARASEATALAAYGGAAQGGDLPALREAARALHDARARLEDAVARSEREAKAAASVLAPRPDPMQAIQERLAAGDALVEYGVLTDEAVAVVLTREDARLVRLGPSAAIEGACSELTMDGPSTHAAATLDRLRGLVVAPLGLSKETKRLLVSPDGALHVVPFAALADGLPIAYVPSGTVYGVLLEERAKRGEGVLALGDPDYSTGADGAARVPRVGRWVLTRVPATALEAKAVGDYVLLGRAASEAGLQEALGKRRRWRAVHFACQGLVDLQSPGFSALALSADAENDGLLTSLEVRRMNVSADLTVLSACDTARGKIVRSEGVLGLPRAFLLAGVPRVIGALWKVDDSATTALMTRFYERWRAGAPTAQALRDAQEFLRSQERWRHPYYWAAWVLWGLAD